MRELFIYYRTKVVDEPALQAAATALQHGLQRRIVGLQARLLRRPDAVDGMHTWMETYALPPMPASALPSNGIGDALRTQIEHEAQAALGAWIVGERHVEVFDTCAL